MPELPEVETVCRGLEPIMVGRCLSRVLKRRDTLRFPLPKDFERILSGCFVKAVRRRAKYILVDIVDEKHNEFTLLWHLGMSGRVTIEAVRPSDIAQGLEKHDHIIFMTDDGARIRFNDARRFGMMDIVASSEVDTHQLIRDIGPEPLGNHFSSSVLMGALKNKKCAIKLALLDQRVVAGLGNIYVCEILYRAHVKPTRIASTIKAVEIDRIIQETRNVLNDAIRAGGSSLKDHQQVNGELGYFQHGFNVYGREKEPCHTEGCAGIVERLVQGGRSSFYCPKCQK